jgi:hypothetical protein
MSLETRFRTISVKHAAMHGTRTAAHAIPHSGSRKNKGTHAACLASNFDCYTSSTARDASSMKNEQSVNNMTTFEFLKKPSTDKTPF